MGGGKREDQEISDLQLLTPILFGKPIITNRKNGDFCERIHMFGVEKSTSFPSAEHSHLNLLNTI